MKILRIFSVFVLIIIQLLQKGNGARTKDKMYDKIAGSSACFRRMNATHQIGCSSERGGSTGAVHFCTSEADLAFILNDGTAPSYIPIMPTRLFHRQSFDLLEKYEKKISGLVLYNEANGTVEHFTHEKQCPNELSNLPNTCQKNWNNFGTNLLYENVKFPIFYIENEGNLQTTKECFIKYNNFSYESHLIRSLCSIELSSFMHATTNTPTCLRRSNSATNLNPVKFCDPLGDKNVWSTLFPLVNDRNESGNFKYIVLSTKMDSTTMFDKTAGAQSPLTGLIGLLSTAKYLKEIFPKNREFETNILFVIFNGETYDYIGSQRFLYDLLMGNEDLSIFPTIKIEDFILFVEFSQLGNSGDVVAHYLKSGEATRKFLDKLKTNANHINFHESNGTLPPSSLHTFLKNQTYLPGILLTDHKTIYSNKFYNSIYDNSSNINFTYINTSEINEFPSNSVQKLIGNITEMIGNSLYEEITNEKFNGNTKADLDFINELFSCYLEDANCRIHQAVQKIKFQKQPFSIYVGVDVVTSMFTRLVGLTLGWVTADDVGEGDNTCTNRPRNYAVHYFNMSKNLNDLNTTRCYRVSMNFTDAISPAFIIKDYDWSSGLYSSWTESTWSDIKIRIFLKPSKSHENLTISIGTTVLILSFVLTYFIKKKSEILFKSVMLPPLAPTNC